MECGQIRSGTAVPSGSESQDSALEQRSYSNRMPKRESPTKVARPGEPPANVSMADDLEP